jgi:hypothetical protein
VCQLQDVLYIEFYEDSRRAVIIAYEIDTEGNRVRMTDGLGNPQLGPTQLHRDAYALFAAEAPTFVCTACGYTCTAPEDIRAHVGCEA